MIEEHILYRRHHGHVETMEVTIDSPRPVDDSWFISRRVRAPEAVRVAFRLERPRDRGRINRPPHNSPPNPNHPGDSDMAETTLTHLQKQTAHATFFRADGQGAPIDGVPVWESSDPTTIEVIPSADGLSCDIVTTGLLTAPGAPVRVTCTADARMGPDVRSISGSIDVTVVQDQRAEAASVDFVLDAPVDR